MNFLDYLEIKDVAIVLLLIIIGIYFSYKLYSITQKLNKMALDLTGLQASETALIDAIKKLETLADTLLAAIQAGGSGITQADIDTLTSNADAAKAEIAATLTRDTPPA